MNPAGSELRECVARARVLLEGRPLSDEAVHEARKALKRARAALRLLRPGMAKTLYSEANAALRDAGRHLAPLRDIRSARVALKDLGAEALAPQLEGKEKAARRNLRLAECAALLTRAEQARLSAPEPSVLAKGLQRIYRKGRKALARAQKEPTSEALHEWRKQVKYLANSLEILGAPDPKAGRRAAKLADRLGDDHDLAMLAGGHLPGQKLRRRIDVRRRKLQRKAFVLGEELYGPKPKRFVRKLS
jgi:CHAD domain-containing protein